MSQNETNERSNLNLGESQRNDILFKSVSATRNLRSSKKNMCKKNKKKKKHANIMQTRDTRFPNTEEEKLKTMILLSYW